MVQMYLPLIGMAAAAFLMAWALTGLILRIFSGAHHRAQPNERTMHTVPTPNIGGLAIVGALLSIGAMWVPWSHEMAVLAGCVAALALVSWLDHYRPVWPPTRFLVHGLAVAAALSLVPAEFRFVPALPVALERIAIGIAWLWMVNLTNFIDGIDGIAATGGAMVALGYVAVLAWPFGHLSTISPAVAVAIILAGACSGYLIWNWHPARIFMGDVGSIPLGFLLGWLMLDLAQRGHWLSALILPAVFVSDATLTLFKRLLRGEKVWRAHRQHFYQRAVQGGATPPQVVCRTLLAHLALIALAVLARTLPGVAIIGAVVVVVLLLAHFSELADRKAVRVK